MNDDDSPWSWLLALLVGVVLAAAFLLWPLLAYKIAVGVFR
jgi:hypothetical protein